MAGWAEAHHRKTGSLCETAVVMTNDLFIYFFTFHTALRLFIGT